MADIAEITPGSFTYVVYEGHSWPQLRLRQYADAAKTEPLNFTGNFTLVVYADPYGQKEIMELTEADGLTKSTNQILVNRNKTQNILKANKYYARLHNDINNATSAFVLDIELICKNSRKSA